MLFLSDAFPNTTKNFDGFRLKQIHQVQLTDAATIPTVCKSKSVSKMFIKCTNHLKALVGLAASGC